MLFRYLHAASLVLIAAVAAIRPVHAEAWPQRSIRIVVPYAPGGNADAVDRLVVVTIDPSLLRYLDPACPPLLVFVSSPTGSVFRRDVDRIARAFAMQYAPRAGAL
jgi:hypothetical protein